MKLPLKVGLPLLGLLLLGLAFAEGREYLLLLVAAMGVALWSAFSLPHPGPRERRLTLVERSVAEAEAEAADELVEPPGDEPTHGGGKPNDRGGPDRA